MLQENMPRSRRGELRVCVGRVSKRNYEPLSHGICFVVRLGLVQRLPFSFLMSLDLLSIFSVHPSVCYAAAHVCAQRLRLKTMVMGQWPQLCHSIGLESGFRSVTEALRQRGRSYASLAQLQAVVHRLCSQEFKGFEHVAPSANQAEFP